MKKIPLRMCLGCREMKEKLSLVRIVKTPDGNIVLDKTGKINGRGAYVCNNKVCFDKCIKTKSLERQLQVKIPQEIIDEIYINIQQ